MYLARKNCSLKVNIIINNNKILKIKIFTLGNTVLCTLHLISHAFGAYKIFKNSGHSLELLL